MLEQYSSSYLVPAIVTVNKSPPITKNRMVRIRLRNEKKLIVQHVLYLAFIKPKKPVNIERAHSPIIPQKIASFI